MTALFINVEVSDAVRADPELARKLVETCPVGIFHRDDEQGLRIVEGHLDECVLCDLCMTVAPGGVKIIRLYESA